MSENIALSVCDDADAVAEAAAASIAAVVRDRADAVIGLATGSTPEQTYVELARLHRDEGLSFAYSRLLSALSLIYLI